MRPQLKIFRAVVRSNAVFMMNRLALLEGATQSPSHHNAMLGQHFPLAQKIAIACSGMSEALAGPIVNTSRCRAALGTINLLSVYVPLSILAKDGRALCFLSTAGALEYGKRFTPFGIEKLLSARPRAEALRLVISPVLFLPRAFGQCTALLANERWWNAWTRQNLCPTALLLASARTSF